MELGFVTHSDVSLINPNVGDLALTSAGTEVRLTSLALETSQRLFCRLNFFKGEWFLNLEEGTPYYERILQKGVSDDVIRAVFSYVISGTDGVAQLMDLSYTQDTRLRTIALTFSALLDDGSTLNSYEFGEFIVQIPSDL